MPFIGGERVSTLDRLVARQWDYPRALAAIVGQFDVYHVIDHSYAHLVHNLPHERTLVTCHDVDAFRSILEPHEERRSVPFKWMSRRILEGLKSAAHVACDSDATRLALVRLANIPGDRLSVVPNGSEVRRLAEADAAADAEAARLVGFRGGVELLHVGTTVPRKRIDVLIEVLAALRARRRDVRLIRVGGPFTAAQRAHARDLGVLDAIVVLPFVDRATLAAVYRRATLSLLPSEREGFGLPLVESLASGTPVVASDIEVLQGGRWRRRVVLSGCRRGRVAGDDPATACRTRAVSQLMASPPGRRHRPVGRVQLVALRPERGRPLPTAGERLDERPWQRQGGDVPAADGTSGRVKRVLHVGKFYPPVSGGMERVLESLCLVSAGLVESSVLVTNTGRTTSARRSRIARGAATRRPDPGHPCRIGGRRRVGAHCPRLRRGAAPVARRSHRPARAQPVGIARLRSGASPGTAGDLVPQRRRAPGTADALFYAPLAKFAYSRAERIVVSSQPLADHADRLAPYRQRVSVIPFGIDPASWALPSRTPNTSRHRPPIATKRSFCSPVVTCLTKGSTCSCARCTRWCAP